VLALDGPDGETPKDFDTVILASGWRPVQRLTTALAAAGIPHTAVEDTIGPRQAQRRHPRRVSGGVGTLNG